ncbi:hydroxyethylthiazole kinase [Saliterribacillus persicus]|uniref:Hydroxyethylthiazole kinase n=1 Tax=Saliterribacillus persicus TaxID=930114 RepID=A0A368XYD3_9BACI|nr:hydroxyethylthiazole kinase [Saliterribacillus persicus]RCW73100.1 hydroxyethylthiazole kinase [Saliterribacillus persicus]
MKELEINIEEMRQKQPLIHNITNQVVMNFTANGLYAMGAAPVMAHAKEEVADMAQIADAVVLNIGTLTKEQVEAMIIAGKSANEKGVPVVLDPVGVGATKFRTDSARQIIKEVDVSLIRGNAGEIASLADIEVKVRGVEGNAALTPYAIAKEAFGKLNIPLAITGEEDVVIDKHNLYRLRNGNPILAKVTGTGCLLTAIIASFLTVQKNPIKAAVGAISSYNIAAEMAFTKSQLPGGFQVAFLDALYEINEKKIRDGMIVECEDNNGN